MFKLPTIMVLGAQGQVGYELVGLAHVEGFQVIAPDRDALDVTDAAAVLEAVRAASPDYVINAAGIADPLKVEKDVDGSRQVNSDAAGYVAEACAQQGAVLIHLSSGEIFAARKSGACSETDAAAPGNLYAETEWQGEQQVIERLERHIILRTSWVYSGRPKRWVRRLLKEAREITDIDVDDSLVSQPTSAADLARVIVAVIKQLDCGANSWGVYHYAGADSTTRYGFAEAVIAAARQYEALCLERLRPVDAAGDASKDQLLLDCSKIRGTFGIMPHPWRTELMKVIRQLYS